MAEMKSNDVYLDSDGTLGISADVDISKVKRILLTQEGTHYGSMYSQDLPDTNVGDMNNSEIPNSCNFKLGDKFILEIGKRQLDEFEIAGTDYYIKIYLLKMLTPYKPEVRTQMSSADCISRQALLSLPKDIIRNMSGEIIEELVNIEDVKALPSVQPEQRWIPCSERLPKEDVEVLVTDDAGGITTIDVDRCGMYEDTKERFWYTSQHVIAWMSLPELYKEESDGRSNQQAGGD